MRRARTPVIPKSRRWSPDAARAVLEALEQSGLPVIRFAARHGVDAKRLYRWRRRLTGAKAAPQQPPRFAEVGLAVPVRAAIELMLPDGITLRIAGATRLDDTLALVSRLARG